MTTLPVRLPSYHVVQVQKHAERIRPLVRIESTALTTHCRQAGLPLDLAELCAGLLASVADDLHAISGLPRRAFERSKRMERVLAACEEPAASALRIAITASPTNGRACVRHWDAVCEQREVGMMAWKLGMLTFEGVAYGKRVSAMQLRA